ncbi:MAG: T9SS type A sorting domain-containing protein [Bacteroidetes bacterium]|nr:T9SS type A sorting domain-containing protein [Bacteroidota bacterium]
MKLKKQIPHFLVLVVLIALSLGFYYSGGGNTSTSISEYLNNGSKVTVVNQQFDNLVGAWTTGLALPSSRYYSGGVGYTRNDSGFVFVFGGDSTGAGAAGGVNMYRYSVNANTWTQLAPLPQGRRIMGSARLGDTVYCIAGLNGPASNFIMYKYNISANSWSTAANVPDSMWYIKATGYQDSLIYLVGGYGANGVVRNTVYLYNSKTNSWRTASNLPVGRADGALALSGDTLVYVGGLNESVTVSNTTYRGVISQTDRSQITWSSGTAFPGGNRYRWNAQSWGNKGIIVAGGATTGFTGNTTTYTYSPGADLWTLQTALPSVMLAYPSGVVRYNSGIWKYVLAGGVTTGPALTGNTFIFTDTLAPPPPPTPTTLVLLHDTTVVPSTKPKRIADRDTLFKHLPSLISGYDVAYFNATSSLPSLINYKTIIIQETSFDGDGSAGNTVVLSASARTDLTAWLASGTAGNKKALLQIGADIGYFYDRSISAFKDTAYARSVCGLIYRVDNGTLVSDSSVVGIGIDGGTVRGLYGPPGTVGGFYPDGCTPVNGATSLVKYGSRGIIDTVAGISKLSTGSIVVSAFQDPRYFKPGQFKPYLQALIGYVKSNGGTITSTTPQISSVAEKYSLSQNYPNPFNPATKISFAIPTNGFVSLKVYDVTGKEVMTLVNKNMTVGSYSVDFNGTFLSSGVYFYRLESGNFVETKKMILVK